MRRLITHLLLFLVYGATAGVLLLLVVYVSVQQDRPDLQVWHRIVPAGEFAAARAAEVPDLDAYLRLEDALFADLDARIYASLDGRAQPRYFRFASGSLADPRARTPNWNRTQVLRRPDSRGAVLALHGLSDSPYSMRALARLCYEQGFSVVALRLPGHGTGPAALLDTDHEDWMAAVRVAVRHLQASHPDQPIYLAGYSTGGALAVEYAASHLLGEATPAVQGLILLSPAIGVSPLATLAGV